MRELFATDVEDIDHEAVSTEWEKIQSVPSGFAMTQLYISLP